MILLVPHRQVKITAALTVVLVVAVDLMHTPIGMNACRLASMFAVPVIIATGRAPTPAALALAIGLVHHQPPLEVGDFWHRGNPTVSAAYYQPLIDELAARSPTGRVEVGLSTRAHGWRLFLLLGLVFLSICAWAVAEDRAVIAVMNVGIGVACVGAALHWHRRGDAPDGR